jgi:hypothetical protein
MGFLEAWRRIARAVDILRTGMHAGALFSVLYAGVALDMADVGFKRE